MNEPDVTLTDYALALLCAVFAVLLLRRGNRRSSLHPWFVLFFAAASAAPLLGGTYHGFFEDVSSDSGRALWSATLLAIGVAAFAGEALALRLCTGPAVARLVLRLAAVKLAVYAAIVLLAPRPFWVAVANYLPAVVFLLVALRVSHRRKPRAGPARAALGLGVTLLAAGLQRLGIGLHPDFLDHNALYHLVQAAGFALLFAGALQLTGSAAEASSDAVAP